MKENNGKETWKIVMKFLQLIKAFPKDIKQH